MAVIALTVNAMPEEVFRVSEWTAAIFRTARPHSTRLAAFLQSNQALGAVSATGTCVALSAGPANRPEGLIQGDNR